eukprot:TRINITY_DN7997_c0_g1_i1.p1 TRINITY_DN7997_c0_g1~~TRINITY_DN7997_c0_g1_i1.p1  ORF type:complete len:595 (-),score=152.14 TRINITY_DN7997_c0_g1_i1:77-1861(-)
MSNQSKVSWGVLEQIRQFPETDIKPILQILSIRKQNIDGFRSHVTDGKEVCYLLTTGNQRQNIDLTGFDIKLLDYKAKYQKGYFLLIVQNFELIDNNPKDFLIDRNTKPMKFPSDMSNSIVKSSNTFLKRPESSLTSSIMSSSSVSVSNPLGKQLIKIGRLNAATDGRNKGILGRITSVGKLFDGVSKRDGKPFVAFNFNMTDETQEIRVSCYSEVATRLNHIIEEGKCYYLSGFSIRVVDGKQAIYAPGQYQLNALSNCEVIECRDLSLTSKLPMLKLEIIPIQSICQMEVNSMLDVVCVVRSEEEAISLRLRSGRDTEKKDLTVVDQSNQWIRLTLWGDLAQTSLPQGTIFALKTCRVGEFNGRKNLSSSFNSKIIINPSIIEANGLNKVDYSNAVSLEQDSGFDNQQRKRNLRSIESIKNDVTLGSNLEKADFVNTQVCVFNLRAVGNSDDFWYSSCPSGNHNKKVTEDNGVYYCAACQTNYTTCNYSYLFQMLLKDETGNLSATALGENVGSALFGCCAKELCEFKEADPDEYRARVKNVEGSDFELTLTVKTESYQGVNRLKYNVFRCKRMDYSVELKNLLLELKELDV